MPSLVVNNFNFLLLMDIEEFIFILEHYELSAEQVALPDAALQTPLSLVH